MSRIKSMPLMFTHAGILASFLLVPVWVRISREAAPIPSNLYATRFVLFIVLLWTIFWWFAARMPGFAELRREPMRALWAMLLLTLALLGFASNFWAFQRLNHPDVAETNALQFGAAALFALVVACASPPRRLIVTALVIGVLWNASLAVLQVANQGSSGLGVVGERVFEAERPGVSVVQAGDVRWIRPYGLLPHPNILAGYMAVSLLVCGAWAVSRRTLRWWVGTGVFLFGLFGLLLTFSRGAWAGFAVGAVVIGLMLLRGRVRLHRLEIGISIACALLVGVVFLLLFRPFILARSGVVTESIEQRSIAGRVVYVSFALRTITEFPLLGVGIGNFPWRASYYLMDIPFDMRGDSAHNIYLSAWAELGTVGFILLLGAIVAGVLTFWKQTSPYTSHEAREGEFVERAVLFGGFVALCVIGIFDHYPWTLLHFQVLWWGGLAAAIGHSAALGTSTSGTPRQSPPVSTMSERTHMPSASRHQVAPSEPTARASGLADSPVNNPPRTG
jgi:O-antigen ligase